MIERVATINYEINIGYEGENESKVILFPIAELREKFPNATFSLVHQRNGDDAPYPCATETDEKYLRWTIESSDVAKIGIGQAQLILNEGNKILKSIIYKTKTSKSLGDTTDVPPPYQSWVDSVLSEFAFSHKLENITCHYVSIPHDSEPHCDSEETETGLILTFYIPMGEQGIKGDKGDTYSLTEQDKSEIASQIHYDDSELRAEIESKAEVFVAEYGVTTYAEVKEAYESGKQVVCKKSTTDDVREYPLTRVHTSYIYFDGGFYTTEEAYFVSTTNAWGTLNRNIVQELNDTNKSHTGSYPSNKAITDYIADGNNLPTATRTTYGVVKADANGTYGVYIGGSDGLLRVDRASDTSINNRSSNFAPIVPSNLDYAVKSALTDGKGQAYTEAEKKSARERIGAEGGEFELIEEIVLEEDVALITRNAEPNGTPYNLDGMIIEVCDTPPIITSNRILLYYFNNSNAYLQSRLQASPTYGAYGIVSLVKSQGRFFGFSTYGVASYANQTAANTTAYGLGGVGNSHGTIEPIKKINNFIVSCDQGGFPSGTKIRIYGVRG